MPIAPTTAEVRQTAAESLLTKNKTGLTLEQQQRRQGVRDAAARSPREGTTEIAASQPIDPAKKTQSERNYTYKDKDGKDVEDTSNKGKEALAVQEMIDVLDNGAAIDTNKILSAALTIPEIKRALEALQGGALSGGVVPNADVIAELQFLGGNTAFREQLRESLNNFLDAPITEGRQLGEKQRALEAAEAKRKKAADELRELIKVGGKKETQEAKYKKDYQTTGSTPPSEQDKIDILSANESAHKRSIARFQADTARDQDTIADKRAQLVAAKASGTNPGLIASLGVQIKDLEKVISDREDKDIKPLQDQLDDLNKLRIDKEALRKEVEETIPNRINELDGADGIVARLTGEKLAAQADYEGAELRYKESAAARAKNAETMIRNQMGRFLQDELRHYNTLADESYRGEIQRASDAGDKHATEMLTILNNRWVEIPGVATSEQRIEGDLNNLLSGGPDQYIKGLFQETDYSTTPPTVRNRMNPETGAPYTGPEITAKMADPNFKTLVENPATLKLLRRSISEGIFANNPEIAERIVETEWGERLMTEALAKNKAAQELMNNFAKEHKDNWGLIKKNPRFKIFILMMLLSPGMGTLFGLGVLGADMIKKTKEQKPEGAAAHG